MRFGLLVVFTLVPVITWAKPKVAVAPLAGDSKGKVAAAVTKVAEDDHEVVGPDDVTSAMKKLDLAGDLDRKAVKKLRVKLEADFVVIGKVEKNDDDKTLELEVYGKGKKRKKLQVTFKNEKATKFKKELARELASAIRIVGEDTEPDDDDDDKPKPDPPEDKPDPDKRDRPDKPDRVAKRDDDGEKTKRDDDDGEGKIKKRRARDEDDDDGPGVKRKRHPVTQVGIRITAGPTIGRRTLTYDSTSAMPPRRVGTLTPGARLEAEIYPFAIDKLQKGIGGLGIHAEAEKALFLKIRVPNTGGREAPINQQAFAAGVRYRIPFGDSTFAFGIDYVRRQYIADRSGLAVRTDLDMPDVDYSAFAPAIAGRFGVNRNAAVFVDAKGLLVMSTGQIQRPDSYGSASVISFEAAAGLDYALATSYGIRLGLDFWQAGFSFNAPQGSMAATRSVSGATDRVITATLALAVTY